MLLVLCSCVENTGQLVTGCDDGRLLLWAYSDDKGLTLLTSARAHSGGPLAGSKDPSSLSRVTGIFPYPRPRFDPDSLHHHDSHSSGSSSKGLHSARGSRGGQYHPHAASSSSHLQLSSITDESTVAVQRGVQGSFLSVGWDGSLVHWLPVQRVTAFSCDHPVGR